MADVDITIGFTEDDDDVAIELFNPVGIYPQTIDRYTPPVGPVSLGAPPPPTPGVLQMGSIDTSAPVTGPLLIRRVIPPIVPIPPPPGGIPAIVDPPREVFATLHSADGTLISELLVQRGLRWRHALNETGAGGVEVPYDHADAALLVPGRYVRCWYHGVLAFTFKIEGHPTVVIAQEGDESAEFVRVEGRGIACDLDGASIYPASGLAAPLNAPQRLFSFASPDFPNGTDWPNAFEQFRADELDTIRSVTVELRGIVEGEPVVVQFVRVPAPVDFPVGSAYWIWGQADSTIVGRNYFRHQVTLTQQTRFSFATTADNLFTLFLDGVPIVGEDTDTWIWQAYKVLHVEIPPGQWTLAALVENTPGSTGVGENPAALLMAMFVAQDNASDSELVVSELITITNSAWRALAYPEHPPGWTIGQVIRKLVFEGHARGEALTITPGFDDLSDTAGNSYRPSVGEPWSFMVGFAPTVMESVLSALELAVDEGWAEWIVRAGDGQLCLWVQGTGGVTTGVTYARGDNITSHECAETDRIVNRLSVKWQGGYTVVEDAASFAAIGQWVAGYATVEAATIEEATRLGGQILANSVKPNQSILMGIYPQTGTNPYLDFQVGDRITAPNRMNAPHSARVIAISVDASNDVPEITLELNERWTPPEVRQAELLQTLGSGVVGQPGSIPLVTINPRRDQMQDA